MTLGEDRVRLNFNVGHDELVRQLKELTAELIDICESKKAAGGSEVVRLYSLAQTCFEDGAMWAVKAATAGK